MNKIRVLAIFSQFNFSLTPDEIRKIDGNTQPRCSVYSYLNRLAKQQLLIRTKKEHRLAYAISDRGRGRLQYLKEKDKKR
jgi:DNA-binding PadR family transcriptional regulator